MKNKQSFHTAALAGLLTFTLAAAGQQVVPGARGGDNNGHMDRILRGGFPEVQPHLKAMAEKLGLSDQQTARIRPVLEELHDAVQKVEQDSSLPVEERHGRIRGAFEIADRKIREFLDGNQKRKLDELERDMHSQMSAGSDPARAPQNGNGTALGGKEGKDQAGSKGGIPKTEPRLQLLAQKLGLNGDQQRKVKQILEELTLEMERVAGSEGDSSKAALGHMKDWREKADRKLRELLDAGQKAKLDELERAPHSGLHEDVEGTGGPVPRQPVI